MLRPPFKQSSQFWIQFCWLFVNHYQEISKLSKTIVKSTISPKLPNLESSLSLSFSKFVKTAQNLSIEMSVVKLSSGMGSSTEVTSVMNVFCLVCCISVKETHLSECVSLCLLAARSNVGGSGDVPSVQQGVTSREGPHPGLHGWVQRYCLLEQHFGVVTWWLGWLVGWLAGWSVIQSVFF